MNFNLMNEKISVIVPVWNAERYLNRCIDSILYQTYTNLEIILVDDGSQDSSYEICKQYAEKDKRVITFHKKNGGQWSARNMALDIATGDYIGFVDNDDRILPRMYEVLYELITTYNSDIARCGDYQDSDSIEECNNRFEIKEYMKDEFTELLITDTIGSHVTDRLFRKSVIGNHRFPYSKCIEDMKFMRTILPYIKGEISTSEKLFVYYNRPDNTSNLMAKTHINSYERAIEFHERYAYALLYCPNAVDLVLSKAVMQGSGSLKIMWKDREKLNDEFNNIVTFFKNNIKPILSNKQLSYKYKIFVFFYNKVYLNILSIF